MPAKLIVILVAWLTTLGGLFIFSSPVQPDSLTAQIAPSEFVSPPTPLPSKIRVTPAPRLAPSPTPSSVTPQSSFAPSDTPLPAALTPALSLTPTITIETIATPASSPSTGSTGSPQADSGSSATPLPATTPTPSLSPATSHLFYTSSHWKAKYYYCDTDDGWKNLSATYLKTFSSEQELLANYSRILHEPCQN